MSGWKVLCFEPARTRRDATDNPDSYDGYDNPNYSIYKHEYGDKWPRDTIQQTLVEDHGASTDSKHGSVFAMMGGYDANWEAAVRDTHLMWDKCAVIEANDTGDVGKVHVFDRTWDGTRGKRAPDLPTEVLVNDDAVHGDLASATDAIDAHTGPEEDYLDIIRVGEVRVLRGPSRDVPDEFDWDVLKVDEFKELECRDGRPVGEKAAAYAQFEWNIHTRAGTPLGWGWDHTRATQHEWRYRVCMEDPTNAVEGRQDVFDRDYTAGNKVMTAEQLWKQRHIALGHAAKLTNETGLETWVEPVPCDTSWGGSIEEEFDPTAYPSYGPTMSEHPRPEEYR